MGIIHSHDLFTDFFKPSTERQGHYFVHLKGINEPQHYKNFLAHLSKLHNDQPNQCILFTQSIPKPHDKALINSILEELKTMRIGHFENEDIALTSSDSLNAKIRLTLDAIIPFAIQNEKFSSETIKLNFIAKLLIWINCYVESVDFTQPDYPKCIFYGPIKRHECYFLILLAYLGLDVLYLNPSSESTFEQVDLNQVSQLISLGVAKPLTDFNTLAQEGVVIEKITTTAHHASRELDTSLYADTGIYRPWQFIKGSTHPVIIQGILEDLTTYWDQQSRMRPGFKVKGTIVHTPVFLMKIMGVHRDLNDYFSMIDTLRNTPKTVFLQSTLLTNLSHYSPQDIYSLAFCLNASKTIDRSKLMQHKLYAPFKVLRQEVQDFILLKLDELMSSSSLFDFQVSEKEKVTLIAATLTMPKNILHLIDCYDFTAEVPKLIFYLNSHHTFSTDDALLLGLLHKVGLDLLILSPHGGNNIELVLSNDFITTIRLPELAYDLQLQSVKKSKSFFSNLFR